VKVSQNPRKPLIFYYIIAMVALMLLNALVFPMFNSVQVNEVGYDTFLKMVNEKQIDEVSMDDTQIKLYPVKRTRERVTFEPTSPVYGR